MHISTIAKNLARSLGLDVRRYRRGTTEHGQLYVLFNHYGVDTVLDVGANIGQYARSLRKHGFKGRIISFEPLSSAHSQLTRAAHRDREWTVAPLGAIGSEEGEVEIHVAGNSASSSILLMLEKHKNAAPESEYIGTERVPLRRLDALAPRLLGPRSKIFLKIDTQGYEDQVLKGASGLLQEIVGIQLELSLAPLYEGQPDYLKMIQRLAENGFHMKALWPGFRDPLTGEVLQFDGAFFRDIGQPVHLSKSESK